MTTPLMTLSEAARQWGMSRQTLYTHHQKGRLSFSTFPTGEPGIDPAEMIRVYGEPGTGKTRARRAAGRDMERPTTPPVTTPAVALSARLDAALEMLEQARQELAAAREREQRLVREAADREAAMRADTARLMGILEQQTRLLEHRPEPRKATSRPAAKVDKERGKGDKKKPKKAGKRGKK
jgi:hypothetical protein